MVIDPSVSYPRPSRSGLPEAGPAHPLFVSNPIHCIQTALHRAAAAASRGVVGLGVRVVSSSLSLVSPEETRGEMTAATSIPSGTGGPLHEDAAQAAATMDGATTHSLCRRFGPLVTRAGPPRFIFILARGV